MTEVVMTGGLFRRNASSGLVGEADNDLEFHEQRILKISRRLRNAANFASKGKSLRRGAVRAWGYLSNDMTAMTEER